MGCSVCRGRLTSQGNPGAASVLKAIAAALQFSVAELYALAEGRTFPRRPGGVAIDFQTPCIGGQPSSSPCRSVCSSRSPQQRRKRRFAIALAGFLPRCPCFRPLLSCGVRPAANWTSGARMIHRCLAASQATASKVYESVEVAGVFVVSPLVPSAVPGLFKPTPLASRSP